jgi:hypothetical protein
MAELALHNEASTVASGGLAPSRAFKREVTAPIRALGKRNDRLLHYLSQYSTAQILKGFPA